MTSLPPGDCCVRGIKHEGTPKGTIEKIENITTYFARPAKPNGNAIFLFGDVFGPIYQNVQLMADDFAAQGYLTVVPDLLHGVALDPEAFYAGKVDFGPWLARHDPTTVDPIADTVIDHLKNALKVKNVAGVGYCFGAKYVIRHLKDNQLDVAYIAHPSFVTSEELSAITKPLSIAASEIDVIFTKEKRFESEQILADLKLPYQINLYGGVDHGFALRGDLSVKEVKFATDRAFEQAVTWFNYWV
ncbi:Hydrolase tropI [Lachnellula cervina]|uniref:Hydrolase tropI n=1 Tax=Lachnellula cervina TaxID=1316786 RepID=A0A7D8UZY1_9HELO|nr:Hydrolase tropI [Lachnellula cervina]